VFHYSLAFVVSLAAMLGGAFLPVFFGPIPLFPYWCAVVLAAAVGGVGPGIVAVVLSTVGAAITAFSPTGELFIARQEDIARLAFFTVTAFLLVGLATRPRRALRRAEDLREWISTMAASIGEGLIATDSEGRVLFMNRVAEELTGWSAGSGRGKPLSDVFRVLDEETRQALASPVESVLRSRTSVTVSDTTLLVKRSGEEIAIEDTASPIRRGNSTVGVVLVFRDATRKRAEKRALAESERLFRSLADTVPALVWIADTSRAHTFFNRAWLEFTGRSTDQESGAGWQRGLHEDDVERWREVFRRAFQNREGFRIEHRLRSADGSYRWLDNHGVPRFDADGRFTGFIGACVDITERKEAEQRQGVLADASRTLTTANVRTEVLETVADLLVPALVDWAFFDLLEEGRLFRRVIRHANPAHAPIAGMMRDFEISRHDRLGAAHVVQTGELQLIPKISDDQKSEISDKRSEAARLMGAKSMIAVPLRGRSGVVGALTVVRVEASASFDEADALFVQDLADRTALAFENAALFEQLQSANRAKDDFLATLSHELRTPMTSILGWAAMLRDRQLDEVTLRTGVDSIHKSARAQAQLIDEVLDISRIVTGKLMLEVEPLELPSVITSAVDTVRPAAEAKQISIDVHLEPNVGRVLGDPNRLRQVIWNLLSNAVKFSSRDHRISVRLERKAADVLISVEDQGQGIPEEFLPHLFQRFSQLDSSSTRTHGGLGIGLALVRHLVELHGGSVSASSEGLGKGARFVVSLPMMQLQENAGMPEEGSARRTGVLRDLRILVVEDDMYAREMIDLVLRQSGALTALASSAPEALAHFESDQIDVILSDIGLPDEDGYSLMRKIRGKGAAVRTPSIALTAFGRPEDRKQAIDAGFDDYIAKPVEPNDLVAAIARAVGR
jgi:PAS domain S-box-containing protein